MEIMQLGKSSAVSEQNQYNVSYLIKSAGQTILLETPPCIVNQLSMAGIQGNSIDWVYLSHQHGDHFLGLPMILVEQYAEKSDKRWNIVIQQNMAKPVTQLIKTAYPELEQYTREKMFFWTIENDFFKINDHIKLKTALGQHGVPSMAVRVEAEGKSIVYSADTGYSEDIAQLAENADLLIHECSVNSADNPNHSTPAQAGMIASKANCARLWLTHIQHHSSDEYSALIAEAKKYFDGPIEIVPDFEWFEV